MFISIEQIKAARALLKWTQKDLAARAGLGADQIHSFEAGRTRPLDVVEAIHATFRSEGIEFVNGGVIPRSVSSYVLETYVDLLDEIMRAMPEGGEVLKHCADDRRSPPEVVKKLKEMAKAGIRERLTISEDNDFVGGNPEDYRRIPARYFSTSDDVICIYLNKVAFVVDGKMLVIASQSLSDLFRAQFEYWWETGIPVT